MKYVILVGDGMADAPVPELGNTTPLEAAYTPHMDALAQGAVALGLARTIPDGFEPGSDVGNMTILGYDPRQYFTGRAPIEAASMGIELGPEDVAVRCNLVTLAQRNAQWVMEDYSAGHIPTGEAHKIIENLRPQLEDEDFELYPGVSYRHLLIWRGGLTEVKGVKLTPPHSIPGQPIEPHLPQGNGSAVFLNFMERARAHLNTRAGKANAIWLWGAGPKPQMPTLQARFGLMGSVISAVDLVRGLGVYAGLRVIRVPGMTGYLDTNYQGKATAALRALEEGDDLVYVHVEAPDEVSHEGNAQKKIQAIEDFDSQIVGPIAEGLKQFGDYSILLLPDHPTPVSLRVHTRDPVPFLIYRSTDVAPRSSQIAFSETCAKASGITVSEGHTLLGMLLHR
ncbi:MAG: cofactor-independent phosphoglycerate mutase [Candidatus Fraserbacteria bacterium RBG_16_55_9]|uniref:Cofactor-independent phosphoglycerate mutase n=1 Tax=Fraserbacteria sp. (strain RBG_16_55_9) TaxID=1817864 RepID=A0A1F5UV91_FRAXR|nr:MAG: cofactor-independent phosphoglycerate mutase [Candidatus Fraserbacteria bacterium RBG_16_55_9]